MLFIDSNTDKMFSKLPNDVKNLVFYKYLENYDRLALVCVCKELSARYMPSVIDERTKSIQCHIDKISRPSLSKMSCFPYFTHDKQLATIYNSTMKFYSRHHLYWAMDRKYMELLKDAFQKGNRDILGMAAINGHLHILQWLFANCPNAWNSETITDICVYAACCGKPETTEWLLSLVK
jgi:hypothetical protein